MTDRDRAIRDVLARANAAGRRVFGFASEKASCAEVVKGRIPDEWDRLCVEGDAFWTSLPAREPEPEQGRD